MPGPAPVQVHAVPATVDVHAVEVAIPTHGRADETDSRMFPELFGGVPASGGFGFGPTRLAALLPLGLVQDFLIGRIVVELQLAEPHRLDAHLRFGNVIHRDFPEEGVAIALDRTKLVVVELLLVRLAVLTDDDVGELLDERVASGRGQAVQGTGLTTLANNGRVELGEDGAQKTGTGNDLFGIILGHDRLLVF